VINGTAKILCRPLHDSCLRMCACANMAHMSITSRLLHRLRVFLQHNTTSHIVKHNNTQQNTTFSKDSSGACYLFSTTYTVPARPGPVRHQRPLPAVNYGYRKMQGGPRSLRHNPNRYKRFTSPVFWGGCISLQPGEAEPLKFCKNRRSGVQNRGTGHRWVPFSGTSGGSRGGLEGVWRGVEGNLDFAAQGYLGKLRA
jgi:hypothetical protein